MRTPRPHVIPLAPQEDPDAPAPAARVLRREGTHRPDRRRVLVRAHRLVLGGGAPGRAAYRPDEVRALERSALEAGMVLQALESERLKREVDVLTLRLDAAMTLANSSTAWATLPCD